MSADTLKRAADMVRAGGTLLAETCPKCGVPLVEFEDKVLCPSCGAEVKIVKSAGEEAEALLERALNELLIWVSRRVSELISNLRNSSAMEENALETLAKYVDLIERVKRIKLRK